MLPAPTIRGWYPVLGFPPTPSRAGTLYWSFHLMAYPACSGAAEGTSYLLIGGHCQRARAAHTGRCRVIGITADKARPAALTLVPFRVVLAALGHSPWSVLRAVNTSLPPHNSRDCSKPASMYPGSGTTGSGDFLAALLRELTTQIPEAGRQRSEWPWH